MPVTARQVPLRDNEALVAYAVLERRVAVWLLRKGEPLRVFTSPVRREELLATVDAFRRSVDVSGGSVPTFDAVAAEKLHRWLLAEPLALLAGEHHRDPGARRRAEHAAVRGAGASRAGGATAFAGARHTFAYVPSATRADVRAHGQAQPGRDRIAPAPRGRRSGLRGPRAPVRAGRLRAARAGHPLGARADQKRGPLMFAPLPATRAEVNRIAATLGVPPDSPDIRLGRAANEKDLKALDLGAYRFLHFATHGVLAGDVPYLNQPALVLSQTADLGGEDGFLTMSEVLRLPLRADMVVLSACQTALGREITGEGVVGLSRAFLYAGSRAAVVSLWPVDDASTAVFMGRFYEHVKGGLPPARALARAKQELRASPAHAHPFYWAPFVFFGAD